MGMSPLFCLSFSISSKISIRYFSSYCNLSDELPMSEGSFSNFFSVLFGSETLTTLSLIFIKLISFLYIFSCIHSAAALGSTFFFSWLRMAKIFFLVSARF